MVDVAVEMPAPKVAERVGRELNGWPMAALALVLAIVGVLLSVLSAGNVVLITVGILVFLAALIVAGGLTAVSPGGPGCCRSSGGTPERSGRTVYAG